MKKTWFTSDQHYFHTDILKFCRRPFNSVKEMEETFIKYHNELVSEDDTVIHVGDITAGNFSPKKFKEILLKLNGIKYLIIGNHDRFSSLEYLDLGFTSTKEYMIIDDIFICHYPLKLDVNPGWISDKERELTKYFKNSNCTKIIHGHSHTTDYGLNRFNIGVDLNDYKPVSFNKILEEFENIHLRKERINVKHTK